jgi:hypothetical protein
METAKITGTADTMPNVDFLARYVPRSLNIVKILQQGAESYKAWDSRTLALDAKHYFSMYVYLLRLQL